MPRLHEIIGQTGAVTLVMRLLQAGRLPHAILIEGLPGSGRRSLMQALAQALVCHQPNGGDSCGTCDSCRMSLSGTHPDLVETRHDSAGPETTADEMRELVVARAYESPLVGQRRAFLLHGMERLRDAVANALLKALEEPPPGTYFIMSTARAAGVMSTIRSRSQLYRLQPLSASDLELVLSRNGIAQPQAHERAMRGSGSHRGLWGDLETMPLAQLRQLSDEGFSSGLVSQVVAALPTQLEPAQELAGSTIAGEQRRALRQWLMALAHDLARELRTHPDPALARRIERVMGLERDLDRNIQPRLVVEALACDPDRRG